MSLKTLCTTSALLTCLLATGSALAHAHLKTTTPAADSSASAPSELRLEFSEGVEAAFTKVELSKDGAPVALKGLATEGADKKTLVVTPPALHCRPAATRCNGTPCQWTPTRAKAATASR